MYPDVVELNVTDDIIDRARVLCVEGTGARSKCCALGLAMNETYPDPSYAWQMGYSWLVGRGVQYYGEDAGVMVNAFDKWIAGEGPRPEPGTFVFKKG